MSVKENKAIAKRWNEEIFNKGNVDVIDELAAENYVNYAADSDRAGFKQWVIGTKAIFSDTNIAIKDTIAEGNKVVIRWVMGGIQTGKYAGIPPTGQAFTISGISIYRIEDGKIVEDWSNTDMLGLMQQLGAIPSTGG